MKKLTRNEADELPLVLSGKRHPVRAQLEALEKGELLQINRADFDWKRKTPGLFIKDIERRSKKKFKMLKLANKSGWVVERME